MSNEYFGRRNRKVSGPIRSKKKPEKHSVSRETEHDEAASAPAFSVIILRILLGIVCVAVPGICVSIVVKSEIGDSPVAVPARAAVVPASSDPVSFQDLLPTQKQATKPLKVNKDLFAKAHRAAIDYSPGANISLVTELQLIEAAVQEEGDRTVFTLFKKIEEIQFEINKLEGGGAVAKSFRKDANEYKAALKESQVLENSSNEGNRKAFEDLRNVAEAQDVLAMIFEKGNIAVSAKTGTPIDAIVQKLESTLKYRDLANKYKIEIQGENGAFEFFAAEELKQVLRAGNAALIKTVGEAIHGKL